MKMNRLILLAFISVVTFSCSQKSGKNGVNSDMVNNPNTASGVDPDKPLPVVEFATESHDFGKITQGEKVSYSFKFKNTGEADLIIASAQGSCGCTVPHYSEKPVPPGEEGTIDVVFDSDGKEGMVKKTVTVVTNAIPNTKKLEITTEVLVPQNAESK
jgi:hypothetical protein